MKILSPLSENHTITLEPRYFPDDELNCVIVNEYTSEEIEQVPTYIISRGVLFLTFELNGSEFDKFTLKLTENDNVVYRCKLFFTSQNKEEYKVTTDKYYA